MPKFLGNALTIPVASTTVHAVQKGYVDTADAALSARVATLESSSGTTSGGQTLAVRSASSAITAAAGDFLLADGASAAFTVTLPASPATNASVAVKKVDNSLNLITVVGSGSTTIDGDSSCTLTQAQSGAVFVFDGSNWRVESTVIFDPGSKNFTYRGAWGNTIAYGVNDVVFYSGSAYLAILGNTGTAPTVDASSATWGLLALHGASAASTAYRHDQSTPGTVWQINHGLGYDPAGLTVISDTGDTIDDAVVQYLVAGQSMRLSFDISIAGSAYLS